MKTLLMVTASSFRTQCSSVLLSCRLHEITLSRVKKTRLLDRVTSGTARANPPQSPPVTEEAFKHSINVRRTDSQLHTTEIQFILCTISWTIAWLSDVTPFSTRNIFTSSARSTIESLGARLSQPTKHRQTERELS